MMMMLEFRNAKITTACYYFRKYDMLVNGYFKTQKYLYVYDNRYYIKYNYHIV